ncbi:P-loop containing nucleoside triphosphate hydrolase protein [Helicostylum pulchrum]|nr:P-loop containing nucleoside triphosphate hydrolase protein [Helicostylum pulchrum]
MDFNQALESLNPSQRDCVLSKDDTLQILAGPGSGKTRVLTMRVAHMVLQKRIEPHRIIVVTFTTKAAGEMRKRLVQLIGEKRTSALLIGTFHAICSRLLHKHPAYAGLDPNFTICEPDDCKLIIAQIQKDKKVKINDFTRTQMEAGAILGLISKAKSEGINANEYYEIYRDDFKRKDIATIYLAYEEELKRQNLVDFDNLLLKTCVLLSNKGDVLWNIRSILVDEYQDTNVVQYNLIKLMMRQKNDKTITIVGDPDQSIFGWRSAEPKNFGKMAEEFAGTTVMKLERNYRSSGMVIDSALHVITQDQSRVSKTLYTNNPRGVPMSVITPQNSEDEANFVAAEIKKTIRNSKGLIQYKDIAVLMRMNFISRAFESTFRLNKIPFTMVGGDRFFNRVEVKDMTSYLSFAFNPKDINAFKRIINVPKRGIGEVTLNKILDVNEAEKDTLLETLDKISKRKTCMTFTPAVIGKLKDFINICEHIRAMIEDKSPVATILSYIYRATDYEKYLKDKFSQDWESRWENLGELLSIAKKAHEATVELHEYEKSHDKSDEDETTFVEPIEVEPVEAESVDSEPVNAKPLDAETNDSDDGSEVLDLTSKGPAIKTDPYLKQEFEKIKTEDQGFNFGGFGLRDDMKQEFKTEEQGFNSKESGLHDDPKDDASGNINIDPIAEFLEYCALCSSQKELDEAEDGKVTIATIHAAKEWPCVFIVTCTDGVIPHSRSEDMDEEGRLLYVAMTRSKFMLYCTAPKQRDVWGKRNFQNVSSFLRGMNPEVRTDKPITWDAKTRALLAETLGKPVPDESECKTQAKNVDIRFGAAGTDTDYTSMGGFSSAASLKRKPNKSSKKNVKTESNKRTVKKEEVKVEPGQKKLKM